MPAHKRKLSHTLYVLCILPLVFLGSLMIAAGYQAFAQHTYANVKKELSNAVHTMEMILDLSSEGDYHLQRDANGNIRLFKGDEDLTDNFELLEMFSKTLDVEFTLFYQEVRVLTTLRDHKGNRPIGTAANAIVQEDVLRSGEAQFYRNAELEGQTWFAYYSPLYNADGSLVGMLSAGRPAASVEAQLRSSLTPMMAIGTAGIGVIIFLVFTYAKQLIHTFRQIQALLVKITSGTLNSSIDTAVLARSDELSEMAACTLHMQSTLRKLIERDALTGLYNRRTADARLRLAHQRYLENGQSYTLAICDIDYFKKINDQYGHDCGDVVLQQVAQTLQQHMKHYGMAARWGGEEFLLIYERSDLATAQPLMEKLLDRIRELAIVYNPESAAQPLPAGELANIFVCDVDSLAEAEQHKDGLTQAEFHPPAAAQGLTIRLTMTIGAVGASQLSAGEQLRAADENLYKGKAGGRNQLVC